MSLLRQVKDRAVAIRFDDERLHEIALNELHSGARRDGIWAKALVAASGNESAAMAEYIRLRVETLREEIYISQRSQESLSHQDPSHTPPGPLNSIFLIFNNSDGSFRKHGRLGLFLIILAIVCIWVLGVLLAGP